MVQDYGLQRLLVILGCSALGLVLVPLACHLLARIDGQYRLRRVVPVAATGTVVTALVTAYLLLSLANARNFRAL